MKFKVLFAFIFATTFSFAQETGRGRVISAYLYNFAKNINWPNEAALPAFQFTLISKDSIAISEIKKLETKTLKGKPIQVSATTKLPLPNRQQLIFVDTEFENILIPLSKSIEGKEILLVTNNFSDKRYVMINFFPSENNTLKFEVNKANVLNQNLTMAPDLILLGGSEIDVATLYKQGQQNSVSVQKKLDSLTAFLNTLQASIRENEKELNRQSTISQEQTSLIQKQQVELFIQQKHLKKLQQEADLKSTQLQKRNEELQSKERKLTEQESSIRNGEVILRSLNTSIDSLNARIKNKEEVLSLQGYTIASQSKILYGLLTIFALVLFLSVMLLRGYRQKNKLNRLLTFSKEELAIQNQELIQSQEEIAAQRDLVALQNKKLEESRIIIEKQNEEIKKRNENLELDVETRTKELVEYNQQLEQFAFISAHNLRAPVARILGLGYLLELKDHKNDPVVQQKLIATTKELDRVVSDLNTILEIKKNNTAVVSEIDLQEELALLTINLEKEIAETKTVIDTDFTESKTIRTIRPYMDSILINLISNSIKYRHPDRSPHITIKTSLKDNLICLTISDNGLGIDLNQFREKLFKLYSRFHYHVEGKGLGLYLVKTQVQALGGTLDIESEVNKGTSFHIFFKK